MPRTIVGIDIGSDAVRAVELAHPSGPRPTVVRMHELPLPAGAASCGEVLEPNTVAQAIKQLWQHGRFAAKDVVLGIGNQRLLARDLTVQRMPLARIRESLPFEVQDLLPVPVSEALLDFYPVSEGQGEHGPVVHGLLIAAVKEAVMSNVAATRLAGLRVVDVDAIPFALCRAIGGAQYAKGTVALVAVGANTTTTVVVRDGVPQFMRLVPTGGAEITRAIAQELDVDEREAETLKRRLGLAKYVATQDEHRAAEVVYRLTNELLTSLRNTLNYYVNTRADETVETIVLTGGGAQLRGFAEALAESTRIRVAAGDPFAAVQLAKTVSTDATAERRQSHAVALGLALGAAA